MLLTKCQGFADRLGPTEFFIVGLLASEDYTIITSLLNRVAAKKRDADELGLSEEQL